jgi:hypothetical protein
LAAGGGERIGAKANALGCALSGAGLGREDGRKCAYHAVVSNGESALGAGRARQSAAIRQAAPCGGAVSVL